MDAFERGMRWFFTGRKAWVLWPIGIIAMILAMVAAGVLSDLTAGAFLLVVPVAWIVGLLGVVARDHANHTFTGRRPLVPESWIPALWAAVYALPVWLLTSWTAALLWWLLVLYIETERRSRSVRQHPSVGQAKP